MLTLHEHKIVAHIKDRYANIVYCFDFENPNENGSNELKFEITIDANSFISKFEANIDGEIFVGETKEKETAANEYDEAKEKDENAILISQPHTNIANVFQIKTNIDAKSKILLSITIEQYIHKQFHFNTLNIQILRNFTKYNITPRFNHISFSFCIEDESGLYDVNIPITNNNNNDALIQKQIMNKWSTKCEINGQIWQESSINELVLKYKIKGEQIDSHVLFDDKSKTFCHIISDIITDSIITDEMDETDDLMDLKASTIMIPRRVMFVIDRSGSMSGAKWDKTMSSTIMAIKQLRNGYDRFGIILFDNTIELLPYNDTRGCILIDKNTVSDAIQALQKKKVGGSTNINDALLKAIECIKIDILLLNNDGDKPNFFMNQIIFITDGKPNNGERNTNKIITNVKTANDLSKIDEYNHKISIFSFGVGKDGNDSGWINDLNHSFLKLLSVNNNAFYQRIKQSSADTALAQYFTILSKPVLSNINIQYTNTNVYDLTQTTFNTLYSGNDIIICGKIKDENNSKNNYKLTVTVSAITGTETGTKPINICKQFVIDINRSTNDNEISNSERIWAYFKLEQFAKQKLIHNDMIEMDDDEKKENASLPLSLALKYKFVTPWTSMIVVKEKGDEEQKQQYMKSVNINQQKSVNINPVRNVLHMKPTSRRARRQIADPAPRSQLKSRVIVQSHLISSYNTLYAVGKGRRGKKKKKNKGKKTAPGLIRIQVDLDELELPYNIKLNIENKDDLQQFQVVMTVDNGYWCGATYSFNFIIPDNYPYKPPQIMCVETIYHPNIGLDGTVCLNLLKANWKPIVSLQQIIHALMLLFLEPHPVDALNEDAAKELKNNIHVFKQKVALSLSGGYVGGTQFHKMNLKK